MTADRGATVAVVASVPWAGRRLYEQRLASVLAEEHHVSYLDPPTVPRRVQQLLAPDFSTPERVEVKRPWVPPYSRTLRLGGLRDVAARRAARRVLTGWGRPADAVVATGLSAAKEQLRPRRSALLVKDDYVAGAALIGQAPADLERRLARAIASHDVVVAVSAVLAERLERFGASAQVIPAGCWVEAEPVAAGRPPASRARTVYLGGLGPRVVPELLSAVLAQGCELSVIGDVAHGWQPGPQLAEVLAHPRVTHWGHVSESRAQELLREADVGVVPYDDSSFNAASFPLKVLEYLAAGLPVVSTPLPALDLIGSDHVVVEAEPAAFAAAVVRASAETGAEQRASCRDDARAHSWPERGKAWSALLGIGTVVEEAPR